jgi:hypothetical protein
MHRERVGEERGSKETDGCPLTMEVCGALQKTVEFCVDEGCK